MEGYKYISHPTKPQFMMPLVPKNSAYETFDQDGLIPRSIRELFSTVEKRKEMYGNTNRITITCQYIQLYNEKVYDLLNSD